MNKINYDVPINDISSDKFNRSGFAEVIADQLLDISTDNNKNTFVFGLYGKWGDGKTSFINLVKRCLMLKTDEKVINKSSITIQNIQKLSNKVFNYLIKVLLVYLLWHIVLTDFFIETSLGTNIVNVLLPMKLNILYILLFFEIIIKLFLTLYIILMKPFSVNSILIMIQKVHYDIFYSKKEVKSGNDFPIIIDFSPWNTANKESLLNDFFNTLKNKIREEYTYIDNETINAIDEYMEAILFKLSNGFVKTNMNKNKDIMTLKNTLEKQLAFQNKKFIIFIDDIDRLSPDEIFVMFKLIKSIANLPQIIYFLSFDKNIVAQALNQYTNNKGEEFLEKFIQAPIYLPQPLNYEQYLINYFNDFIESHKQIQQAWTEKYQDYWNYTAYEGFLSLFKSPRDVIRYFNTLNIAYNPHIHNEVNIIDFMIIIALQLFVPELHAFIFENEKLFLSPTSYRNPEERKEYEVKLDEILENYDKDKDQQKNLQRLISNMFPYAQIYYDYRFSQELPETSRKNGRICCKEHFYKFFTYNIDEEEMSLAQMKSYIDDIDDLKNFSEILLELNSLGKIKIFLQRLEDYIDDIPAKSIPNLIKSLFDLGDYFNLSDEGFWATDIYVHIDRIVYKILNRQNINSKLELLQSCITNNKSLFPAINFVKLIKRALMKNNGEIRIDYINNEQYLELASLCLSDLYKWAKNDLQDLDNPDKAFQGHLINHRKCLSLLYFWQDVGEKELLNEYIGKMIQNDKGLLKFLSIFKHKIRSFSGTHYSEHYEISKNNIVQFLDIRNLEERLKQMDKTSLSIQEQELIELALTGLQESDDNQETFDE